MRAAVELLPGEAEAEGLLALMLLHDARRAARTAADGTLVPAQADLLRRLGRTEEARATYERALALVRHPTERRFLERRLTELG